MTRFQRFLASQLTWFLVVAALFLNLDVIRASSVPILIIGGALSFAIIVNLGIWFGEGIARAFDDDIYEHVSEKAETNSVEKRKRERIDRVLRDMSDDDLLLLQERLQDGSVNDEILYEHIVGDDGELMQNH